MAKNRLKGILNKKTPHFIAKFYVYFSDERDDHGTEWQLFVEGYGGSRWFPKCQEYTGLQYIELNDIEIEYFKKVFNENYNLKLQNEDGKIYEYTKAYFDKSKITNISSEL